MHNFKKALLATLGFLICLIGAATVIVWPYYNGQYFYYEDAQVREDLAGSIDTILSGASHGYCAFDPNVMDEALGTSSYNLAGPMMTLQARETLLRKELDRNPVKTVFIELSCNTLTRNRNTEGPEGDIYTLPRMGSLWESIRYFFDAIRPGEYLSVCADTLDRGIEAWKSRYWGKDPEVDPANRGQLRRSAQDLSMTTQEYNEIFDTIGLPEETRWDNKEYLWRTVELCQERGIEVVFITTPLSDRLLAESKNLEEFRQHYLYYAELYGCTFLDFNLYRQRDELLPDDSAFYDKYHLSESGAEAFTRELADVYARLQNGEDIRPLFYENYDAMKQDLHAAYNTP